MVIISENTIRKYIVKNKITEVVADRFYNWYRVVSMSDWGNLNEIKKIFNAVDYVGNDRYVFNIMGNHYRIITMIHFNIRTVYILFIGTHKEYDKIDAKEIKYKK